VVPRPDGGVVPFSLVHRFLLARVCCSILECLCGGSMVECFAQSEKEHDFAAIFVKLKR
jgi:hypothetical protein